MIRRLALIALGLSIASGAVVAGTNALSEAEIQGRKLAQQILEQRPAESFTNTGVLIIDDGNGRRSKIPVKFEVVVAPTNWYSDYQTVGANISEKLSIIHTENGENEYEYEHQASLTPNVSVRKPHQLHGGPIQENPPHIVTTISKPIGNELMRQFAGSDFWIADLGLEFFHWPQQKILKPYEMRRGRSCKVLESTNPNPTPNGYSRVVSWIDNETLGIVQAEAYDAKGGLLKEFYPKDFKKVNGQWEMGEMEIRNDQTGSRTWIKFDLKKPD